MKDKNIFATLLNVLGLIQIIFFTILLILMVWTDNPGFIQNLLLSDFISFVSVMIIYYLLYYTPEKDR
jgi:hypothetical protein